MRKRVKLLQMRLTEIEYGFITSQAKRAGRTVTDHVVALAYAVGENPVKAVAEAQPEPVRSDAPVADRLAALKAQFNLKSAADLEAGADAAPPAVVKKSVVPPRPFNSQRRGWYALVETGEWWQIVRDITTKQTWLCTRTAPAREFQSEEEARRFVDSSDSSA